MARDKKDFIAFNCKLERDVALRLDRYCAVKGQTKTLAVERILKEYFDDYDKAQETAENRTQPTGID